MPDFRSTVKLNKIPVLDLVPYSSGTAPSSPSDGLLWYDTTNKILKQYNGTTASWLPAGIGTGITDAQVAAGAAIAESKLSLASDAAAGVASRRTLGFGSTQAMQGSSTLHGISAQANDGDVALNAHRLTGVQDPSGLNTQDAATAAWVTTQISTAVSGQDWKDAVDLATTGALSPANSYASGVLTATGNGALTVDGVAVAVGNRILVKDEATGKNNGIYDVTATGGASAVYVLTRSSDANTSALLGSGTTVPVTGDGVANPGTIWLLSTADPITLDSTTLTFTQIGAAGSAYTAGSGLTLTGNQFSLTSPVTVAHGGTNATTAAAARTSLGTPGLYNSAAIGDNASLTLTVTHNLGNTIPSVTVYDVSGTHPVKVECDITATDGNTITLTFATAPATASIQVVVVG